jgi:hypothetical protein
VLILRRLVLLVRFPPGACVARRSDALTAPVVRKIAGDVHSPAQDVAQQNNKTDHDELHLLCKTC